MEKCFVNSLELRETNYLGVWTENDLFSTKQIIQRNLCLDELQNKR